MPHPDAAAATNVIETTNARGEVPSLRLPPLAARERLGMALEIISERAQRARRASHLFQRAFQLLALHGIRLDEVISGSARFMQIVSPVISRCLSTLRNSKLGAQFFLTIGCRLKFVPSRESSLGWFTFPYRLSERFLCFIDLRVHSSPWPTVVDARAVSSGL